MPTIRCLSHGVTKDTLLQHAQLIKQFEPIPYSCVHQCWTGIDNYPVTKECKRRLRSLLLGQLDPPSLWKVSKPIVIIYRWPNGELRFFLISQEGHLFESSEGLTFLRYFNFIEQHQNSIAFKLDSPNVLGDGTPLLWLPQNKNYSHFLLDYFAPYLLAAQNQQCLATFAQHYVLTIEPWLEWQQDLFKYTSIRFWHTQAILPGHAALFYPDEVILPVVRSQLQAQINLKHWLISLDLPSRSSVQFAETPIVFCRRHGERQSRIRNQSEISALVTSNGGLAVDISKLNLAQKASLLRNTKILIGDGSASVNASMFLGDNSLYVALSDPVAIRNPDFLIGGFPYGFSIAHQMLSIVGERPMTIPGSPLFSCSYPIRQLQEIMHLLIR